MGRWALVKVEELPLGERPLSFGIKGRDVRELQTILQELRLLPCEPTGEYDYLTMEAVRNFQKSFSIYPDGKAGFQTIKMLKEPGIQERLYVKVGEQAGLADLGLANSVNPLVFKNPENRRKIRQQPANGEVLIEKREVWTAGFDLKREEIRGAGYSGFLLETGHKLTAEQQRDSYGRAIREELKTFHLYLLSVNTKEEKKEAFFVQKGVVYDLREEKRISGKTRRKVSKRRLPYGRLKQRGMDNDSLVFWWLSPGEKIYCTLPTLQEADGIIVTPPIHVESGYSHQVWQREIRRLIRVYPCTRILVHFDLRGRERTGDGEENWLTFYETKALRLSGMGSGSITRRRLEDEGWIHVCYEKEGKAREALLSDIHTLRGILARVDRMNLAGVVITGADFIQERLSSELNRFFTVAPRRWV
ncbi:MAG TPA: peptidoglycan-binding domain-containing protein [Bacillota bacterium]